MGRVTSRHHDARSIHDIDGVGEYFKNVLPGDELTTVCPVVERVDLEDRSMARDCSKRLGFDGIWQLRRLDPVEHDGELVFFFPKGCCPGRELSGVDFGGKRGE